MSLIGRPIQWHKHCFVYCGPERCDCGASATAYDRKMHEQHEADMAKIFAHRGVLTTITLTGVDELTSLPMIATLSERYPLVEWGFLYSPSRQGQPGRYPSIEFLQTALTTLPKHVKVALHVCGHGVPSFIGGEEPIISGLIDRVHKRGGRVQLNFNNQRGIVQLLPLALMIDAHPGIQFITQHNAANEKVWETLHTYIYGGDHAVLFDASGGHGVSPMGWPKALPSIKCGYAGGLGPDNLATQLDIISSVAGDTFWVDMEGKIRDPHDHFDLDVAEHCLQIAAAFAPKIYVA